MKLDSIPEQVSLDQVPAVFVGNVKQIETRPKKQGGFKVAPTVTYLAPEAPKMKPSQTEIVMGWNIPKALTGKGQMDQLFVHLKEMGIGDTDDLKGRTFVFKRENLAGSMQGNPRHYPVLEIKDAKDIPKALAKFQPTISA